MKPRITLFLLLVSIQVAAQQPSRAEMDRMIKEGEKKRAEMLKDPKVKAAMEQAGVNINDLESSDDSPVKIPKKSPRLAQIQVVSTQSQLVGYLQILNSKVATVSDIKIKSAIEELNKKDTSAIMLSRAAVIAWYKKQPAMALVLASNAAKKNPNHPEILNTLASILSMCGYEHKAIPILVLLNTKYPGNPTVLNNLGQAYYGLGDQANAEKYLSACIAKSNTHTEANKTLGFLYRSKGQTTRAKQCFQQSLKGGFSQTAVEGARLVNMSDEDIDKAIIHTLKDTKTEEYFNIFKYQLPQPPQNLFESVKAKKLHADFQTFMQNQEDKYSSLMDEQALEIEKKISQLAAIQRSGGLVHFNAPLFEKARRMQSKIHFEIQDWALAKIADHQKYEAELRKLNEAYRAELRKATDCKKENLISNNYQPLYSQLWKDRVDKILPDYRAFHDQLIYWSQYLLFDSYSRSTMFGYIKSYFDFLEGLSRDLVILMPSCVDVPVIEGTGQQGEEIKPDCPIDVTINFIVGKLGLDCESISLSFDAGVSIDVSRNFVTKESTLAVGIGASLDLPVPIPIIEIGGSIGINQQMYVVFDGNNVPRDVGMTMSVSAGVSSDASIGPVSTGLEGTSIEAGYNIGFGLNTGIATIDFSHSGSGLAQGLFDK